MSHEELYWIETCKADPGKYRIDVDNDCVFVTEIESNEVVFTFNSFGWEFIVELLRCMGCNAESV